MASQKYIVNGVIFEDDESGDKIIVAGRVLETLSAAGGDYQETLSESVTSSAAMTETYDLGAAYQETLAQSVTSSAATVEAFAQDYQETLAESVTSSVATLEAVNFSETFAESVTSSASTLEAVDYSEILAESVTSLASAVEAFEEAGAPTLSLPVFFSVGTNSATVGCTVTF